MKMKLWVISFSAFLFAFVTALAQDNKRYPDWHDLSSNERVDYNTNPVKILPDAQVAFQKGEYGRTLMLCSMHWVVYGDANAGVKERNELETKSKRGYDLSQEMTSFVMSASIADAKKCARQILELNPEDSSARKVLEMPEPQVIPAPEVSQPQTQQTQPLQQEPPADTTTAAPPQPMEPQTPIQQIPSLPDSENPVGNHLTASSRNILVAKIGGGIGFAKTGFAPEIAAGLYDMSGSRIGTELCAFANATSFNGWGIDASLVLRLSNMLYMRGGAGFFSYSEDTSVTHGMNAVAGVNLLLGRHFCLDLGIRYYPEVQVMRNSDVTTAGVTYTIPTATTVQTAGILPSIKIGWAF